MERRKQYNDKQVQQDLYQYEMGIELGADVESEKLQHKNEYQQENRCRDYKNDAQCNQKQQNQNTSGLNAQNKQNQNQRSQNQNRNQNRNEQQRQNNRNNFR